jgi:hypothetical protein
VTTLPLYLPHAFGVVVARTPALTILPAGVANDAWQLVAAYQRDAEDQLVALPTLPIDDTWQLDGAQQLGVWLHSVGASTAAPFSARFQFPDGERLIMTAVYGSDTLWPGGVVDVWMGWQSQELRAWPDGVMAFVHLRRDGANVSQQDGLPRYFVLNPQQGGGKWADWRQLPVPEDILAGGVWQVVVGLYDPAQGTRLPVVDVAGNVLGNEAVVGTVQWVEKPVPDQSCALIPATCVSQGVVSQ